MVVAELEVFHSRAIAPTRRVALGETRLPVEERPALGPVLLAVVVAAHIAAIDPDHHADLERLMTDVEQGRRIAQPRLRHRFQTDRVGLQRSTHRLIAVGSHFDLRLDDRGAPVQQALAAIYAVGTFAPQYRRRAMDIVRQGAAWTGPIDRRLLSVLSGAPMKSADSVPAGVDPLPWALAVFGFEPHPPVDRRQVQSRYRELLRDAHPDHGGAATTAASRIAELADARRILLGAGWSSSYQAS